MVDLGTAERLFEHSDWANERVVAACERVSDADVDRPIDVGRGSLRKILLHIEAGERVWLARWRGAVETTWPDEELPTAPRAVRTALATIAAERKRFFAELTPARLAAVQPYRDSRGSLFEATLGDMLLQGLHHSTHHRAQAVNVLRRLGHEPPELDYMMRVRRPASGAATNATTAPSSGAQIREATRADIPVIMQLIRDLAAYERAPDEAKATPEALERHLFGEGFGRGPTCECLIAEWDGKPEGFALHFTNFSTWLAKPGIWLEDLFVRPAARRHGLGTALLRELARLAVARGCGRMEWSVLDWNEPAIAFYRSHGAISLDEWTTHRLTGEKLKKLAIG